jgi:NADPH:quinone reductase-like Zn-dependent oxidoreductase
MKAVYCTGYGSSDVLSIREQAIPSPAPGEILIRTVATITAPADIAFRKGDPFIARAFTGFFAPKKIPGDAFAGTVAAIGSGVTKYKVGDEVFGSSGEAFGTNAEYLCIHEDGAFVMKPASVSHAQAAAVSEGSLTALPFLRDAGLIKAGSRILINGAAGGVGVYAVQIAKIFGAEVTGVCGKKNRSFVSGLGADHVICYDEQDFIKTNAVYDIVFDAVGKSSYGKCRKILSDGGRYMTTVPTGSILLHSLLTKTAKKKAIFMATGLRKPDQKRDDLKWMSEMMEQGRIRPVIDREFTLETISEAHRYVETGHKRGSVVVRCDL